MGMALLLEREVLDPREFYIRDDSPELITWLGRKALRLTGKEASLVLHPGLSLAQGRIEVEIGTEGAAYPGIVFRAADTFNYELAYAQPHTSGNWDALQYDPVFHGSNTWQIYFGEPYQKPAEVPIGTWFRLRVEFRDRRALVQAGDQPPLLVDPLAHHPAAGRIGLWTYKPAFFSNLRVWDDPPEFSMSSSPARPESRVPGTIDGWFLEGFGAVACEPNGILNLNRYLPVSVREVRLQRRMDLSEDGTLTFHIGFSDELSLKIDGQEIFSGSHTWKDSPEWAERGYVSPDHRGERALPRGVHTVTAELKATEYFGYGLVLRIDGSPYTLLPAELQG
jgi:hypothetical protein